MQQHTVPSGFVLRSWSKLAHYVHSWQLLSYNRVERSYALSGRQLLSYDRHELSNYMHDRYLLSNLRSELAHFMYGR